MEGHFTAIAISIAGPAILGVFGFLWRVNSKMSSMERTLEAHERRITNNTTQLQSHFDKAFTIRKTIE